MKPANGFDFNPLLKYPRNETCYCGSGLKFKKCCLTKEVPALPQSAIPLASTLVKLIRAKKVNG